MICRFGNDGHRKTWGSDDDDFLGQGTTVGYAIIVPAVLLTYLLGANLSILELFINFVGGILFIIIGALAISYYQNHHCKLMHYSFCFLYKPNNYHNPRKNQNKLGLSWAKLSTCWMEFSVLLWNMLFQLLSKFSSKIVWLLSYCCNYCSSIDLDKPKCPITMTNSAFLWYWKPLNDLSR